MGKVQDAAGHSFYACRPDISTTSPITASPLSSLSPRESHVKAVRLPSSLGITPVARTTETARNTNGIDTQCTRINSQHPLPDWCLHYGGKAATTAQVGWNHSSTAQTVRAFARLLLHSELDFHSYHEHASNHRRVSHTHRG